MPLRVDVLDARDAAPARQAGRVHGHLPFGAGDEIGWPPYQRFDRAVPLRQPVEIGDEAEDGLRRRGHRRGGAAMELAHGYAPSMTRWALAFMAVMVAASWSLGLNWMNSVPASAAGTCPGVM
jgi:hypothetical protein